MSEIIGALSIGLFVLLFVALVIAYVAVNFYGIYLSFKKKWYIGAVALLVPGFSLVVGLYKAITKKDLLK